MPRLGKSTTDYLNMSDEEVLSYVHSGCKRGMEHLIEKYKPLVRAKARSYFWWAPTERILFRKA